MKQISIFLVLTFLTIFNGFSQKLTLTDLITLCNKKNWEDVNQILLTKAWTYYDSEKGNTFNYNTITWSFNKDYYSDKAQGWFYLYTYEGLPNKIAYTILKKESYTLIQNSLSSNGFKLTNSEIEDNEVISTYSNQNYILKISTEKRNVDDDWSDRSLTAYNIILIKKAGIYDPDNGAKTDYYYDGYSVQAEYTLKNGELNGTFKSYYQNGNIMKTGNYINGKENGLFKEYNEEGSIKIEYTMKNGELNGAFKTYYENGKVKKTGNYINGKEHGNFSEYDEYGNMDATYTKINDEYDGLLTIYENGKVIQKINYINGVKNGIYTEFTYDDNDSLLLEYSGNIKNELQDSIWNLYLFRDGKKEIAEFTTYKNDIKEGNFKKIQGDSIIFGNYINDELDGDYIVYVDLFYRLFGGTLRTDTSLLNLESRGKYTQGKKSGNWIYYSFGKVREGHYRNDLKEGEWKYYYSKYIDKESNNLNYSEQLYLTETYESDKLNGKSVRLSYIHEEKVLCDTVLNKNENPLDTCIRRTWIKCFETSYYKDNLLHGAYILKDSSGNIRFQGNFLYEDKDGVWIESYIDEDVNDEKYIVYLEGNYKNGKREGKWIKYVTKDYIMNEWYYSSGKLNGKYYSYNRDKMPINIKIFEYDKLKSLSVYDSTGTIVLKKYEILKETDGFMKVLKTEYNSDYTLSIEYYMKKDEPELNHLLFEKIFINKSTWEECYPDGLLILEDNKGNIIQTGNLLKKNRFGTWKFNFAEQNVQIQIEYTNGIPGIEKYYILNTYDLFSGTFVYNNKETGNREKRKIKDGLRNGNTVFYDVNDKKIKTEKYKDGVIK